LASLCDGAGAQSLFALAKRGRRFALSSLLVKTEVGVADAWVRNGMSKAEADVLVTEIFAGAEAVEVSIGFLCSPSPGPAFDDGLTETADYCAAARIGTCVFRKRRTRSIVRCFSSSGSFHGNTVISAFGASEATSIEVCSGCPGTSSGSTSIGVRQFLMKSRDTL